MSADFAFGCMASCINNLRLFVHSNSLRLYDSITPIALSGINSYGKQFQAVNAATSESPSRS
jgi:hypothetical protein